MDWRWLEERRIARWCNIRCIKNKTLGSALAWLFALFAVIASFGIGNMTQGNSISGALHATFYIPTWITEIVITVLACNNRDYIICIFYNPTADIASGRAHIVRWTMVLRRPKRSVDLQRCAVEVCHAIAWCAPRSKNAEAFLNLAAHRHLILYGAFRI